MGAIIIPTAWRSEVTCPKSTATSAPAWNLIPDSSDSGVWVLIIVPQVNCVVACRVFMAYFQLVCSRDRRITTKQALSLAFQASKEAKGE